MECSFFGIRFCNAADQDTLCEEGQGNEDDRISTGFQSEVFQNIAPDYFPT